MESPTRKEILKTLLLIGPSIPAGIANATDRHPKSIQRTLKTLREEGLVARAEAHAPYKLTVAGYPVARKLLRVNDSD